MSLRPPWHLIPGEEQYETYTCSWSARTPRVQYDYRAEDGELFSCVAPTVHACRCRRDLWLSRRIQQRADSLTV
jgi:hypothetical protein